MTKTATRRKTSFEIDTAKVAAAKEILGTKTLTETVDAALSEVVKLQQREKLLELLDTPGAFELDNPKVMRGAWR
jgi:Arc/MetJ family transcription regulator